MMIEKEIEKSSKILKDGGIILYPTDTIWGIGCDATNKEAIKRIYTLKKRAKNKVGINKSFPSLHSYSQEYIIHNN